MQIVFSYKIIVYIIVLIIFEQISTYVMLWIFMSMHEIGHLIVIKILKLKIKKMYITPFGFNLRIQKEPTNLSSKLWLESAGLITNLILIALGVIMDSKTTIFANLTVTLFNIVPIYPLDGGRILDTILSNKMKKIDAQKKTNKISKITLIIITILTSMLILKIHNFILILAIVYLWICVAQENKRLKLKERIYNVIEENKFFCKEKPH